MNNTIEEIKPKTELWTALFKKQLIVPLESKLKGKGAVLARQLDIALMDVGFKLSHDLLTYLSKIDVGDLLPFSAKILNTTKELVGGHVQHNVYFKNFPDNVPDTEEFWFSLLIKYYRETGGVTNNLLDFPEYGNYQHTYEEMLAVHSKLKIKNPKFKVINLGGDLREELQNLYKSLAGSSVPLNEDDRNLIGELYSGGFQVDCPIAVRENKAIINSIKLENGGNIQVDTVTDVLRLACQLSGGDVTLTTKTKFKIKRRWRRALMEALNALVDREPRKLEDVLKYQEQFKRLGEQIHPHEYDLSGAKQVFDVARGTSQIKTWNSKLEQSFNRGEIKKAIRLLTEKPGYFARTIDRVLVKANTEEVKYLVDHFEDQVGEVSSRVLISLYQHLENRKEAGDTRIFVNKKGTGYCIDDTRKPLNNKNVDKLQILIEETVPLRIPEIDNLVIDKDLYNVAVPLSDKSKSEGFNVLPRGSIINLEDKDVLRFFMYWKQHSERTDYDLSCVTFTEDWDYGSQLSWTNLRSGDNVHSGDITDATKGATEFIDLKLASLPNNIKYLIPTVNYFAGETYDKVKESFFGFMMRDLAEKGKPFEASTVKHKFDIKGSNKRVCLPLVFYKDNGWKAKWLDLYSKGVPSGNRVEQNKFSTMNIARSVINKKYLTMEWLLSLYIKKAKKVSYTNPKNNKQITYVGLARPEWVKATDNVYTLSNLKDLVV